MSGFDIPSRIAKEKGVFEKRCGDLPVPLNVRHILNAEQKDALQHMATFGWRLAFVRRKNVDETLVVVRNQAKDTLGLLLKDGSIDTESQVDIRADILQS